MPEGSAAFVSYSREDSEFALRLVQDLKAAGANVWLDQLELVPGRAWDNAIEDALLAAQQMLVVLSPTSVKSENVRDEISYALKQGKTVIPVLYMECVIPLRLERRQHIDFRQDYARGLAHLLKYLDVASPDPAVLEKAAASDAQRQVAWQAREAEAQRLSELTDRNEPEDAERKANEELRQKQEAEAARVREEQRKEEQRKAEQAAAEARVRSAPFAEPPRVQSIQPAPQGASEARKLPKWAWGALAAAVLIAVFAAGRQYTPKPVPQPQPQPAIPQVTPASSPTLPSVNAQAPSQPTPDVIAIYNQADALYGQKNYSAAAPLFDQACAGGSAVSCGLLGFMYMHAMGVPQSYSQAFTLNSEACDGGDGLGCNELGYMYDNAEGVQQNYPKAVALYAKACDAGSSIGCNQLGNMYFEQKGVARDHVRASQLYTQSCNEGSGIGCDDLGSMYRDGDVFQKNTSEARALFQKGCNLGEPTACADLKKLQ